NKLKWRTHLLFSYSTSEASKYYGPETYDFEFLNNGNVINPIVGQPLYSLGVYKWAGLDENGNPQGYLGKKKSIDYNAISMQYDPDDDMVFTPSLPAVFGSVINTFNWKSF